MSYILPVGFEQYQQYQNRVKGIKSNDCRPASVERVKKAYLFSIQAVLKDNAPSNHSFRMEQQRRKSPGKEAEIVYAQLTGIGGIFNATA